MAGICLPLGLCKGTVSWVWKMAELLTGCLISQKKNPVELECIFRSANHKARSASQWEAKSHTTRTVLQPPSEDCAAVYKQMWHNDWDGIPQGISLPYVHIEWHRRLWTSWYGTYGGNNTKGNQNEQATQNCVTKFLAYLNAARKINHSHAKLVDGNKKTYLYIFLNFFILREHRYLKPNHVENKGLFIQ